MKAFVMWSNKFSQKGLFFSVNESWWELTFEVCIFCGNLLNDVLEF